MAARLESKYHAQVYSEDHASTSRDIPFNQLVLSQSNVRQIKAGVSIEELAEDIARRTLLQKGQSEEPPHIVGLMGRGFRFPEPV